LKIVVDTNVLVRLFANDDEAQNRAASQAIDDADAVLLTLPMLCELGWVLSRGYRTPREDLAAIMRSLLDSENVEVSRPAVEAGIAMLAAGGDFADGVIAYEGRRMGGDAFVSFDLKAVRLLEASGLRAHLLD
jgi:predicted nucleic-acid-binding protein